jgi:hypothetical protein
MMMVMNQNSMYMNDHIDTKNELKKLRVVSEYLRDVIGDD